MSPEDRRKLIESPIRINTFSSYKWAGLSRRTFLRRMKVRGRDTNDPDTYQERDLSEKSIPLV